jgi:hypothetical protein
MDKPISVGDLVMVVRCCCVAYLDGNGPIFRVHKIHSRGRGTVCTHCRAKLPLSDRATDTAYVGVPLPWLKRIPPLEELEGREENLKEPA